MARTKKNSACRWVYPIVIPILEKQQNKRVGEQAAIF